MSLHRMPWKPEAYTVDAYYLVDASWRERCKARSEGKVSTAVALQVERWRA